MLKMKGSTRPELTTEVQRVRAKEAVVRRYSQNPFCNPNYTPPGYGLSDSTSNGTQDKTYPRRWANAKPGSSTSGNQTQRTTMKTLIKAGASRLTPSQLVDKSDYVVGKMTGNLAFATPSPSLAAISAANTALKDALEAANSRASEAIAAKNQAARTVRALLTDLARYVNSVAEGESTIALSSGFDAALPPAPIVLVAPAELRARMSAFAGAIDLSWPGVRGSRLYEVQMSATPDNEASWQTVGTTTRRRFVKTGLPANVLYSFRVFASGALGEGPMSEIASAKAA